MLSYQNTTKMQIAIFDYLDSSVTIYNVPKDIEERVNNLDEDFDLNEWVENLPFYHNQCMWMTGFGNKNISIIYGKDEDLKQ